MISSTSLTALTFYNRLEQVRRAPAWVVTLSFGLAISVLYAGVGDEHGGPVVGAVALALILCLAAALTDRSDQQGWTVFSIMVGVWLVAQLVDVSPAVRALFFTGLASVVVWATTDRRRSP